MRGVREQHEGRGGGELLLPGAGRVDIEDGVRPAGLEDGQDGDDEFGPAVRPDRHEAVGGQSGVEQMVGQLIGPGVELSVREAAGARDDGSGARGVPGPLLEAVHSGVGGGLAEAYGLGSLRHGPMMPSGTDNGRG